MKKILIFFLLVMVVFSASCNAEVKHWTISYSLEEIEVVEIIEFDMMSDGYTVLSELDKELFDDVVADVEAIEFKYYGTNLSSQTGKGIKISFVTGEYDIITAREPKHYEYYDRNPSEDGAIGGRNSWLECDESMFNALIEKYCYE